MYKYEYSLAEAILDNLFNLRRIIPKPYENRSVWTKRVRSASSNEYNQAIRRMQNRGLLAVTEKNNRKFLKLTDRGQLEALMLKARIARPQAWDGKWRLFIFDIPEGQKDKRNTLRKLLKQNGYKKLQASVYINPHPLNREAVLYLNSSGLRDYIRILKVEEVDYDKDLLKKFGLKLKNKI